MNSLPLEPCEQWTSSSPACGSPPRFRPPSSCESSNSRCRSRTPSPPHSSGGDTGDCSYSSSSSLSSKTPRSVSPGGTPASSAGRALRSSLQGAPPPRSVSWSTKLVTSVNTRPRTLRKDVASLFYSRADEKRFRREAEFAVPDDDWAEQLDEDSLGSLSDEEEGSEDCVDNTNSATTTADSHKPLWQRDQRKDYAISKAVVTFGDSTKTYGVPTPCSVEVALEAEKASSSFSFDDTAFWNGQLTWS